MARSRSRSFSSSSSGGFTAKLVTTVIVLGALAVLGGVAFLATWDMPAPSMTVEKVLPDERFPR